VHLTGTYVDETFATASNTGDQRNPGGGPDARYGKTDSYLVVDLGADFAVTETFTVTAGAHNLLDDEYVVSRVPLGPRPGKPRFVYLGLESSFD
jgi:Fe(3+) dicitrate transport protein